MKLQDQLNKMLNDYTSLSKSNEEMFGKTMKDIEKLPNKKEAVFFREALIDAKAGKLNVSDFLKKINTLKDVG